MKRRLGKFGLIFLALALCLSITGAGFAMWSKTLDISGTVKTGEVNAIFTTANCTEDPEVLNKSVGSCNVTGAGTQTLNITIDNGYPCYGCTINFTIDNIGTVPVTIQNLTLSSVPTEIDVTWPDLEIGTQIDPDGHVPGSIYVHVNQTATENATYNFSAEIYLVQWNEYETPS